MIPNKSHIQILIITIFIVLFSFVKTDPVRASTTDTLDIEAYIVVIDIKKFNDETQELNVDFVVNLLWKNIPPAHPKGADTLDANLNWISNLQIMNESDLTRKATEVEKEPDGRISLRSRYVGTVKENLVFKDFPFDRQAFRINIIFPTNKPFRLYLQSKKNKNIGPLTIANWTIEKTGLVPYELSVNRPLHGFSYVAQVMRKKYYYLLKFFLPIAIIVLMSLTVFWVDPDKIDAQLTVSSTAVLTLIAFLFSLSFTLPKISYLTKMDLFLYSSLVLVFLALTESIYTSNLATKNRHKTAKKADKISRYVFSVTYLIILVLIYFI